MRLARHTARKGSVRVFGSKSVKHTDNAQVTPDPAEVAELVDKLNSVRQFLATTAQFDTAIYRFIEVALASRDLDQLREALEWSESMGWP
jgi:hypothetical protein